MACTTRVDRRLYGMKRIPPLHIAVNVAAVAKSVLIVQTVLIRVPQIEQRMRYGLTGARQDAALERDRVPTRLRVDEIPAFGRIRPEVRARDGGEGRLCLVLVYTCRCQWRVPRQRELRPNPCRTQRSEHQRAFECSAAGPWARIRHVSILVGQAGACKPAPDGTRATTWHMISSHRSCSDTERNDCSCALCLPSC